MAEGNCDHTWATFDTGGGRSRPAPGRRAHVALGGLGREAAATQRGFGTAGGTGGGGVRPLARRTAPAAPYDSRQHVRSPERPGGHLSGLAGGAPPPPALGLSARFGCGREGVGGVPG